MTALASGLEFTFKMERLVALVDMIRMSWNACDILNE
jgi:hypothetical protein